MDGKSYWNNYLQNIDLGIQLNSNDLDETEKEIQIPSVFNQWCKGNVNNGKILFISIIRELLFKQELNFALSLNHSHQIFPIESRGVGDFRNGAKSLLKDARLHLDYIEHLPTIEFFGILVSDLNPDQKTKHPIRFYLSSGLASVTLKCKSYLESFCLALIENLFKTIDSNESASKIDLKSLGLELLRNEKAKHQIRKEIILKAWDAVFEHNIEWNKNYHSNGGDSIQAIRFLSKLKLQGAEVDLAGLINAFSLSNWVFSISENINQNKEFIPAPSSFPLTEMQQKIWSHHLSFKDFGAYHEQFLFELKLAPSKQIIESGINAIWKSYPNIRIHIQENNNQITQNEVDSELIVLEYTFNSIEEALADDRKQPFEDLLIRLKIISIRNKSYLLWSHHHLILDGWSVGILIHEFIERITSRNFKPISHPNYQYKLHRFENDFPANKENKLLLPIVFPINNYHKENSFQTIQFEKLTIDLSREDQLTKDFQITKQLLFCGISGVILHSFINKPNFYFNGISSGRDFLEGEIDQAVGLFIRNIQIPIFLDELSTWNSFYHVLNSNFQKALSTKNRIEASYDISTNSDFLFVYENYPYTDLKSDAIDAELIHVNEITGYPITFCLFPNPEGYALRIVYDARRFDEQFIIGLKIKFEQTYNLILNSQVGDFIFEKKTIIKQTPNALIIDSLTNEDLDEIGDLDIKIRLIKGSGWKDLFDDDSFSDDKNQFDAIEFWKNQLFSNLYGEWKDVFVKEKKLELKQTILSDDDTNSLLVKFIKYLKFTCWQNVEFQINIQKNNSVFPLIISEFEGDNQLIDLVENQLKTSSLFMHDFLELFAKHWSRTSNFLVVFDDSVFQENWERFDLVLKLNNVSFKIYSNETISSDFTDKLIQFLSNPTSVQFDKNSSYISNIHESNKGDFRSFKLLFEDQVATSPDRVAVDDGKVKLTYQELDCYSNQLASFFNSNFNLSELSYVGLRLRRGNKQLASILALIKLGKAFIPLDTDWPEHRVNQIVEQADLKLIIDKQTLDGIPLEDLPTDSLNIEAKSLESTFYALFTSGSTGIPKGCVISEFAFLNYLDHCRNNYFQNADGSNIHVFTPLTFDFTLTSFLGGIAFGCSVILHSEDDNIYDSLYIALNDDKSSVLKLTPSHISLAEKDWFSLSSSKILIVGGEALTEFQIAKCLDGTTNRLINEYGPTEATVGCVYYEIKPNDAPLIGLPINGMGVMILDEDSRLVSKGQEGELCLFGNGLSDGYLNDVKRTDQSFQKWNGDSSFLIYRTGDLVKMQHDGQLLFISRKDGQIKLNGYRIETDEISFAVKEICGLNSHSLVIENGPSKQLVTFVEGLLPNINILDEVKKWLPSYMLPSRIIELDNFPVTTNGKFDHQKLRRNYLEKYKQEAFDKNEILNIQEILEEWKMLGPEFHSILSYSSLKTKGWNHFQKQIHFLTQVKFSDIPILIPKSILNRVPEVLSSLNYSNSKITQGKPALICKGTSFSYFDLTEYAQRLKLLEIKLTESNFSLFSNTINNLVDTTNFAPPLEIESEYVSFLKVNENALVRDWSRECGFPFIIFKNSTGDLICSLPSSFKNKIIDTYGNNQPDEWEGKFLFLATDEIYFRYSNGQLTLNKRNTIERFSQIVNLSIIEKLVHEINKDIECAYAKETDNRIYVYIQSKLEIDLYELEQCISKELPSWFKIEKVIHTKNISELINRNDYQEIQKKSTSFIEFLETNLSEYGYLSGTQSLIEQGGDSITALRIVGKLKNKGYRIEVGSLLNAENISEYLLNLKKDFSLEIKSHDIQLTPIQKWFLEEYTGNKNHFNQSILLELQLSVESGVLLSALKSTLENHSILSEVFIEKWEMGSRPRFEHIRCETDEDVTKFCSGIQESFDLKAGPVACGAVIEVNNKILLFISIHHLYCDGYTWRIILDDLQEVLQGRGVKRESSMVFGKVRNQFHEISAKTQKESKSFYGNQIQNPFSELKSFSYKDSYYLEWEWSVEETKWFQYSTEIGTTANEKFMFLFLNAWLELNYEPSTVFFETHGRFYEGIPELTETIGWFTQFYPLFCSSWPNLETLKAEITSQFEQLPQNGLTYMSNEAWHKPPLPILLNYLGNFDENRGALAIPSIISQGEMTSADNPVLSMVEVNALIVEGKMKWMLRMHPQLDPYTLKNQLNNSVIKIMGNNHESDYITQSIDQDDLDAINDLLGGL
jgi:amino acid adenylation domain-containing protein